MLAWGLVGVARRDARRRCQRPPEPARRRSAIALALSRSAPKVQTHEPLHVESAAGNTPAALRAWSLGAALPFDLTTSVATLRLRARLRPRAAAHAHQRPRARLEVRWENAPPRRVSALVAARARLPCWRARWRRPDGVRSAARTPPRGRRLASPSRRSSPTCTRRRTPTAASARRPGSRAASSTPRGPRWAWRRPGAIPLGVRRDGHSVLDALRGEAAQLSGVGDVERTILALHACGASARSLAGRDLVAEVLGARAARRLVRATGQPDRVRDPRAARRGATARTRMRRTQAARWLARQQEADGGFGFAARGARQRQSTTPPRRCRRCAAAGAQPRTPRSRAASPTCAAHRTSTAASRSGAAAPSNAQSTAWAIQGLVAAGRDAGELTRGGEPLAARLPARRWSVPTAACATRERARRRRCG